MGDQQKFKNEELVLKVSSSYDRSIFKLDKYEQFISALCGAREYQKEAIRTALIYLAGGRYENLRSLALENYQLNNKLQERYGSFSEMENHLQLPTKLAGSIDLATGTGKSYVMYGIARILLAEGLVNRVLVLCPSVTIETGLTKKFLELSGQSDLIELLPSDSKIINPHIINGTETIEDGMICIENSHATLPHVKSSIRDSLAGKGSKTLVLNDEIHHVYNKTFGNSSINKVLKKWKEFLLDPRFEFHMMLGFSGTCYVDNDYFSDVIYRYPLLNAIEQGFIKSIEYVSEDSSEDQSEKFQKIYDNHIENKTMRYRKVKPITILVTQDISKCKLLTTDLVNFIAEKENISIDKAEKKVLIVTSSREHQINIRALVDVDHFNNQVEWITSVSMLTEGWDVKNVFQIVPHEERAFNSKLLIAQVLGRGLRVPEEYKGERPVVTVFNHDNWSKRIKHLVEEVMEYDRKIFSYPILKHEDYNFQLHNIEYGKPQIVSNVDYDKKGEYDFDKGYITLGSQVHSLERQTVYEQALSGNSRTKTTLIKFKMFSVNEVAEAIFNRLRSIDMENEGETDYSEKFNLQWLINLINKSIKPEWGTDGLVSEENRQRIYKAFNVLSRQSSKVIRYQMTPENVVTINTIERPKDNIGFSSLRRADVRVFYDENTLIMSDEETKTNINDALEDWGLDKSFHRIENSFLLKTSLNLVIANHEPEYKFIRNLLKPENADSLDAWIKSTDQSFYAIEFGWRKGEHTERSQFNPDFFLKKGNDILVIEIKGDEEIEEASRENKGKYRDAKAHFERLNNLQDQYSYYFHFLTPKDMDKFFKFLRDEIYQSFVSDLDVALENPTDIS